jgi:hypothetical protein
VLAAVAAAFLFVFIEELLDRGAKRFKLTAETHGNRLPSKIGEYSLRVGSVVMIPVYLAGLPIALLPGRYQFTYVIVNCTMITVLIIFLAWRRPSDSLKQVGRKH